MENNFENTSGSQIPLLGNQTISNEKNISKEQSPSDKQGYVQLLNTQIIPNYMGGVNPNVSELNNSVYSPIGNLALQTTTLNNSQKGNNQGFSFKITQNANNIAEVRKQNTPQDINQNAQDRKKNVQKNIDILLEQTNKQDINQNAQDINLNIQPDQTNTQDINQNAQDININIQPGPQNIQDINQNAQDINQNIQPGPQNIQDINQNTQVRNQNTQVRNQNTQLGQKNVIVQKQTNLLKSKHNSNSGVVNEQGKNNCKLVELPNDNPIINIFGSASTTQKKTSRKKSNNNSSKQGFTFQERIEEIPSLFPIKPKFILCVDFHFYLRLLDFLGVKKITTNISHYNETQVVFYSSDGDPKMYANYQEPFNYKEKFEFEGKSCEIYKEKLKNSVYFVRPWSITFPSRFFNKEILERKEFIKDYNRFVNTMNKNDSVLDNIFLRQENIYLFQDDFILKSTKIGYRDFIPYVYLNKNTEKVYILDVNGERIQFNIDNFTDFSPMNEYGRILEKSDNLESIKTLYPQQEGISPFFTITIPNFVQNQKLNRGSRSSPRHGENSSFQSINNITNQIQVNKEKLINQSEELNQSGELNSTTNPTTVKIGMQTRNNYNS